MIQKFMSRMVGTACQDRVMIPEKIVGSAHPTIFSGKII